MKYDEFAFFNQQLAAMLRDGIPLEGALRRLCEEMRAGSLRTELQTLEADLAKGTPMADALPARQLPELYKRMILVGVKSGDLPGALTMLADYFHQVEACIRFEGVRFACAVDDRQARRPFDSIKTVQIRNSLADWCAAA